ncbi:hypothetical protein MYX04_14540, partial [Nitrospiraceae bacterium AH_259_D15_M11_P09]|nr:hypothetical protein [Nitrospiraceae bacterium AH_259_D15_M11_P09]
WREMMRTRWAILLGLCMSLWCSAPGQANTGDISGVIERFLEEQFPRAKSHFWVVNGTQWQTKDELVVDVNTVVVIWREQSPVENRYLLLIVEGKLAASQSIPLGAKTDCEPELA